jgi:CheY-like chemotaxis protein
VVDVRVLVVDDSRAFREALLELIDLVGGFRAVGQAASGEESLELAQTLAPDLVLLDVRLPGLDGLETSRRLVDTPDPPTVVLVSTDAPATDDVRVVGSGASAVRSKAEIDLEWLSELRRRFWPQP